MPINYSDALLPYSIIPNSKTKYIQIVSISDSNHKPICSEIINLRWYNNNNLILSQNKIINY